MTLVTQNSGDIDTVETNQSSAPKPTLSPTALSLVDAAMLLTKAGGGAAVTEAMLRADIDCGAPRNADGTLNLVFYAAWLVQEIGNRD